MFEVIKKFINYDPERDFYAKHFPSVKEDDSILVFRPMKKTDILPAREIEKQVYNYPWSELTFHECFKAGYSCWVFEKLGEIYAYGILSFGAGEVHIMNFCVSLEQQRKGYGQKLMEKLIEVARQYHSEKMLLEVRPSNVSAIRLYQRMGFTEIGQRKDYYPGENGREDALMFGLELVYTSEPDPLKQFAQL